MGLFKKIKKENISNREIKEFKEKEIAFCVSDKCPNKKEILDAVNQTITELTPRKVGQLIYYHTNRINKVKANCPIDIPTCDYKKEALDIYTSVDAPPFDYLEGFNDVKGVEIDILKIAANKMKRPIRSIIVPFGQIFKFINTTDSDCAIIGVGTSINKAREKEHKHIYSLPFWTLRLNYLSLDKSTEPVCLKELNKLKLGVCKNETGHLFLEEQKKLGKLTEDTEIIEYERPDQAYSAFMKGKLNGLVVVDYVADALLNKDGKL